MVTLQQIYEEYEKADIPITHWKCKFEAVTLEFEGDYGVFIDFFKCTSIATQKWKLCHEYGHCTTGATHKLSSPYQLKAKHEYKANKKAALTFLPPQDFEAALKQGFCEPWELAEWFDIPEEQIVKIWVYYVNNGLIANQIEEDNIC